MCWKCWGFSGGKGERVPYRTSEMHLLLKNPIPDRTAAKRPPAALRRLEIKLRPVGEVGRNSEHRALDYSESQHFAFLFSYQLQRRGPADRKTGEWPWVFWEPVFAHMMLEEMCFGISLSQQKLIGAARTTTSTCLQQRFNHKYFRFCEFMYIDVFKIGPRLTLVVAVIITCKGFQCKNNTRLYFNPIKLFC